MRTLRGDNVALSSTPQGYPAENEITSSTRDENGCARFEFRLNLDKVPIGSEPGSQVFRRVLKPTNATDATCYVVRPVSREQGSSEEEEPRALFPAPPQPGFSCHLIKLRVVGGFFVHHSSEARRAQGCCEVAALLLIGNQ